ncbi:MAG TPA: hypothetical protein VIV83_03000 [Gemmatimonadales bacterium]
MTVTEASARALIQPQLWDGEELLWCDLPRAASAVAAASARQGFLQTVGAVSGLTIVFAVLGLDFLDNRDASLGIVLLVLGALVVGGALTARTLLAWVQGQRAARRMAYGITNRRVLVVRSDHVDWVGPRGLEDVVMRGDDVIVTRQRSEIESLWNPEAPGFGDDDAPGQGLIEKANAAQREITLASLHDPQRVLHLVQTLKYSAAS